VSGALRIQLVTPARPGSRQGNRVSAERWARLLGELGHDVTVRETWDEQPCDLLVALHARKSAAAAARFRARQPGSPLVVALTGTDLYQDLATSAEAQATVAVADRLVALQPLAADELPAAARPKLRVLLQSAEPAPPPSAALVATLAASAGRFAVCVLAHLREVKDPLCAARAARLLPPTSRLLVLHAGAALDPELGEAARREMAANDRYRWLGELSHDDARALLAACRLLVVSSRLEGGANVVSEAIVAGVPVVTSRIAGSLGLLGEDYPACYPVGDEAALAVLLLRAERDPGFLAELRVRGEARRPLLSADRERDGWRALLAELFA
jgi:putative glycosyltransferase (TIGR04348 family)